MDKRLLSDRDICTKYITPALLQAGLGEMSEIHEEVSFTKGRIIDRGKLVRRGKGKRADYLEPIRSTGTPGFAFPSSSYFQNAKRGFLLLTRHDPSELGEMDDRDCLIGRGR